ncbi:hypothetical protein ACGH52_00820 [Streptomyces sp. BBFR25]
MRLRCYLDLRQTEPPPT